MLKKIYQELVAIRKEIQVIKIILEPKDIDVYIGDYLVNALQKAERKKGGDISCTTTQ